MDTSAATPGLVSETARPHYVLVDGSGYIFRYFHGSQPLNRSDGTPTNAVFGFTKMLMKLINDMNAGHCAVIFDRSRYSFRNEIYDQYKAQRPNAPEDLVPQFPLIRDAVRAFNIPCIEMEGYEADDLIATYATMARERSADVTILSSDKDLMQLVGHGVRMYDPAKDRDIDEAEVIGKFGVGPEKVIDVQALAGDSSDNVPGVPGIGIKTAAQLITEYGDLDTLLDRAGEIRQPKRRQNLIDHADMARISRQLVTLKTDVPVPEPLDSLAVTAPDDAVVLDFLRAQEFESLIRVYEKRTKMPVESVYELVQDLETLKAWISEADHLGTVGFDSETDSLNARQARVIGLSLATAPGRACYIPLRHGAKHPDMLAESAPPQQIPFDDAISCLKPLLANPGVLKVGHNIKFDALVMAQPENGGVKITPVDDTMCLAYVMGQGVDHRGTGVASYALDKLSLGHLAHANIPYEALCGKGKAQIPFSEVALDRARDYAAEDADMTLRLHRQFRPALPRSGLATVYETLERPLIPVLVAMENDGIKVDPTILRTMSEDFRGRIRDQEAEIHDLANKSFNIGSPKQLAEILFDEMKLPGGKKNSTGGYSTGANVLEDLAADGHELPARVLDWRQMSKLKSTYTDALVGDINPATGRIHTSYSMTGANTGRLSSNTPNLQNIPVRTEEGRKIRTAFIAEPGHVLLSVDYSQIELRLLAHIAGIDSLKQAFYDGIDIHAQTASEVFDVALDEMTPDIRRNAKAINFGIIYGISAFGLARQLRCTRDTARNYIHAYFERYPGIRDYMEATKGKARKMGYVETLFGRKVHLSRINSPKHTDRAFSERAAVNAPIQGTAADIIKRAMIRLPQALDRAGLVARMLLQVHDELLLEVLEDELDATSNLVRNVMEAAPHPAIDISVPLVADVGSGANWADAH